MLFNTFTFALAFLPFALAGYFLLSKISLRLSVVFLLALSLVFYAYGDATFVPLLLASIVTNFFVGNWISRERQAGRKRQAKGALIIGLVFNLGLISFFKYFDFFVSSVASVAGIDYQPLGIPLPIGISFFTFTQIAYLVDCYAGESREYKPENYGLFVTYFPHLISGPILHHKDMMPQFDSKLSHVFSKERLIVGSLFFIVGLFKKIVIADGIARFVGPVFDVHHANLTMVEAWCGALAYTFQLYFDFSAYSDMAYGLSYMFGVILPINFLSPYKATSIIEFWRRWHITLSTFLRDYLYIALGGSRRGAARRYANLMTTMLLGGLWHGANWTFVVWGGLHGAYLIVNHFLRHVLPEQVGFVVRSLGWFTTFIAVVVGWVFFRATSIHSALDILRAMAIGTFEMPAGAGFQDLGRIIDVSSCIGWIAGAGLIAFALPNIYTVLGRGALPSLERRLSSVLGGLAAGVCLVFGFFLLAVSATSGTSEFLYFNF